MSAITAVTAQNTLEVKNTLKLEPELVRQQIDATAGDIQVDAVKTGMLVSAAMNFAGSSDHDAALGMLYTRWKVAPARIGQCRGGNHNLDLRVPTCLPARARCRAPHLRAKPVLIRYTKRDWPPPWDSPLARIRRCNRRRM